MVADRVRRRPLPVGTDAGRAVVLAAVPVCAFTGTLTIPLLTALMFAFRELSVGNDAAHQSFLPRAALPRANARIPGLRRVLAQVREACRGSTGTRRCARSRSARTGVTPDGLQGRMNSTMRSVNRTSIVLGAPLGGLLADAIGLRPALWVGVVGMAAGGVATGFSGLRHAVR